MIEHLVVLHARGQHPLPTSTASSPWRHWKTCVRSIAIGLADFDTDTPGVDFEVLRGVEGYRFLTEVAAGLHSPIVAETEVFGQFKDLIRLFEDRDTPHCKPLRRILESINVTVKVVRHRHLAGVGRDSYGSYVRRACRDFQEIHVIGSGSLAQEIVPWLVKSDKSLRLHARDIDRARRDFPQSHLMTFDDFGLRSQLSGAVIVCAPIAATTLHDWLARCFDVRLVVDLRADSGEDRLNVASSILRLADVFETLQAKRHAAQARVGQALADIRQLSEMNTREWPRVYRAN
jgi:glutamyl-tRNA reductase